MLNFDALQNFLQVRPSLGLAGRQDDLVISPMKFPGTQDAVRVYVRPLDGGRSLVHDAGEAARHVGGADALMETPVWESVRAGWIDRGVSMDEENRLFTVAHSSENLPEACARIFEAQLQIASLSLMLRALSEEAS